ncbi:hypothetical protein SAY87_000977 [Trapa incisa]|uniref:Uncharacterized protein n=1 Tax=Trapa incisa TaxID=236973 RepID=A0AAN7GCV1_9MYRT|nr:hypothetical protein SAY87_000977 [Trapa incisa]
MLSWFGFFLIEIPVVGLYEMLVPTCLQEIKLTRALVPDKEDYIHLETGVDRSKMRVQNKALILHKLHGGFKSCLQSVVPKHGLESAKLEIMIRCLHHQKRRKAHDTS